MTKRDPHIDLLQVPAVLPKKALAALTPKKRIMNVLDDNGSAKKGPWDKRQEEIKNKLNP